MKTQEVIIEIPKGFEVDKEKSTFEKIIFKEISDNFQKVFEYHKTTKEEFDEKYKNIPPHLKAYEKECLLVAYYNKGWTPDFQNSSEYKHYPWFYMDNFRLFYVCCCLSCSSFPARLLWKSEKDVKEAVKLYLDVFKESREF